MSKQKLSILIYSLAGGGAERVVSVLLHELKEHYDITLVLMRDKIDYEIPKDTKIHFLEDSNPCENGIRKLLKLPFLGFKYKIFCKNNSIDVSLAFMNRPSYVAIFSKIFGNQVRNIISERTTPSMMYQNNNLLSKVSKLLIKKLYPISDVIIANSEGNRIDLIDNFNINKEKIITIPNLFDLANIKKLSHHSVDKRQFDRFTFVTAGRLDKGKNHKLMIDAFSKLKNVESQLLILGEGNERSNLAQQIEELELEKRVFLLGFDNNPYKYFAKSDVFVFSSNYEGFPNVLIEALACGLPIVSTDCKSGPREILSPKSDIHFQCRKGIEESSYGILTPVGKEKELIDALTKMIEDKVLRDQYSKEAKERAASFNKDKIAKLFTMILK